MHHPWYIHRLLNRLQSALLIGFLMGLSALAGGLLLGELGVWIALGAAIAALAAEPAMGTGLTLRLYRARPIHPTEAPELWSWLDRLARRAGLPATPRPYYVPSRMVNAFATGAKGAAAIALTDGLLRTLTPRELAGVLAHEVAHIAHDDLRVMGLADTISRLTSWLAAAGQLAVLLSLPLLLTGQSQINLWGLLLLAIAPQLALLAQLGLSRVREFDADRAAAQLTGDPLGLAAALVKIERVQRPWLGWIFPGWANPEPSWLRTHPPTEQRVARLRELSSTPQPPEFQDLGRFIRTIPLRTQPPRWYFGGFWR
ncbi:M48 family metalloprotease [Caldichromatium japonicum]|uniref:M48 family metalloprotease n=1 Tax=Caldichromatium japonicum TaxID=2699430 RepID=A0A6G7VDJ3_9GAMM|nr:M48 family metalloprotease [Caldichromatium japonicum]